MLEAGRPPGGPDEAAAGRVRPVIGQEFGLAQAAAAHEAIETRATIGKTLLVVPGGAVERSGADEE